MTKEWLFSVANKGPQKYKDATIEVYIKPSEVFDGRMMIGGVLRATNQFTTDMRFGGGFVEDVTDEEVSKMDDFLCGALKRMESAKVISTAEPITLKWVTESALSSTRIVEGRRRTRLYGYDSYRDEHFSIYTNGGGEWGHAIGTPVIIDGKLYKAQYSFWLGRYVYPLKQREE